MKLVPSSFQEIRSSAEGSSTSWYVLVRNGVGMDLCNSVGADSPVCSAGNGAMMNFSTRSGTQPSYLTAFLSFKVSFITAF